MSLPTEYTDTFTVPSRFIVNTFLTSKSHFKIRVGFFLRIYLPESFGDVKNVYTEANDLY